MNAVANLQENRCCLHISPSTAGYLYFCGETDKGQGNRGPTPNYVYYPERISSSSGFIRVAAGESHFVALKRDGSVWAWGLNDWGQTSGSEAYHTRGYSTLHQIPLPGAATMVAAGYLHSYALVC